MSKSLLTKEHLQAFHEKGYTVVQNALTTEEVTRLHDEADELANYLTTEGYDLLHDLGGIVEPLECGYLDTLPADERLHKTELEAYIKRRDLITENVASWIIKTLAPMAGALLHHSLTYHQKLYLLNEQYIIKPPKTKSLSTFQWHKDGGYYQDPELRKETTVACWVALDDVNEHNGTLLIGTMQGELHADLGDKEPEMISVPAGSIVFLSSQLWHKSLGNESALFRRVFMPQFSKRPLLDPDTSLPVGMAVPMPNMFSN